MFSRVSRYVAELNRSFAAVFACLEVPRIARRAVLVLLAIHSGLLAYSAYVHSPTLNEPGHLAAGLSHWKFGRFDIYSVNPPLVRMVAALPVIAVGYEENWSGFHTGPGSRQEMQMGEDFIAANGERSFFLFTLARWACIPFSWLGAIICYLWARDVFGRPSGVLAAGIWCFEPNILAHASLMTPDAHATALGAAACYTFWRWLKSPSWTQAALTGVVLGFAELCKTTLVVFYPLWPLLWVFYRWPDRRKISGKWWLREGGMLLLLMAIGVCVLNFGYGFEGSLQPLRKYQFVSDLFRGESIDSKKIATAAAGVEAGNRFANLWSGRVLVPLPENYLLGIDLQQRDFENYGRRSYLRGEWSDRGWWYYYLYAALIKVPLGLLLLGACGVFAGAAKLLFTKNDQAVSNLLPSQTRRGSILKSRDFFVLLLPPTTIFVVVSSKTGFSEHFRYVLPCFPFAFIVLAGWVALLSEKEIRLEQAYGDDSSGRIHSPRHPDRKLSDSAIFSFFRLVSAGLKPFRTVAIVTVLWVFVSSLWIYPHSLSYFNETIGGPLQGSKHLLGSNLDWGQDHIFMLQYLKNRQLDAANIALEIEMGEIRHLAEAANLKSLAEPSFVGIRRRNHYVVSANVLACSRASSCESYKGYAFQRIGYTSCLFSPP